MRLQEVYSICKHAQENWGNLLFEEKRAPGNIVYHRLTNLEEIKNTLSMLDPIESFGENIAAIRKTSVGFQQTDDATFDTRAKNALIAEYQRLNNKVITVTELFESFNYKPNSNGFDVKLPPEISLSDLSKCTKDLNIVFSTCPLLSSQEGTINFSAVDVGSVWLSFVIGGVAVTGILTMIAALVDKALIIRSHYLTTKEQSEKIRSLQLGNDALEEATKINKAIGDCLLEKVSSDLASENNINDPEDMERLKNSIDLLANWMCKGMEIYASVQTEPETKAVFPPISTQSLPESTIALLTQGTVEETE